MKPAVITPEYVAARYRRLHTYNDGLHNFLRFQYKFDYQWFWRTKFFDLGSDITNRMPSNDELEKKVRAWLDLRTRTGSM